jgi:hypothetical protein
MNALLAAASLLTLLPGTYTNEEQVYFAGEAGKPAPPWVGVTLTAEGEGLRLRTVDAFGKPGAEDQRVAVAGDATTVGSCTRAYRPGGDGFVMASARGTCRSPAHIAAVRPAGLTMRMADGTELDLRRARGFTCWASILKAGAKGDTGGDWYFTRGVKLHDAGGRA